MTEAGSKTREKEKEKVLTLAEHTGGLMPPSPGFFHSPFCSPLPDVAPVLLRRPAAGLPARA